MSTLPGGPADKAGNMHEALWGVYGMVTVLGGQANAIRIEEPGSDGADFYLDKEAGREHWQAKRQILGQKTWSLQLLSKEGILTFFRDRVNSGEFCVFASISDAPELRGLTENSSEAQDYSEFTCKFLSADEWKRHFENLKQHLGYGTGEEVYSFLKKVRVEGGRESTIEALLQPFLNASFTGLPTTVLAILRDLYTTSVHRKLTAEDILRYLGQNGIISRSLAVSTELCGQTEGVTAAYLAGQESKIILGRAIPRQACVDMIEKIRLSLDSLDVMITSPAGGGKSAGLLQIVNGLIAAGVPVLAFRLDRLKPVASTEALGKELGLPESPAVVLSQCYPKQPVALVIDQLDFVSATSGRHPDFFEIVAALADEVRGLRGNRKIHLLTTCREFDFKNDSRIRRLLPPSENPVKIGLLSQAEVENVVVSAGGDPKRLSAKQVELLRLPQNLSLFVDSGLADSLQPAFVTQKELLDAYWDCKRRAVSLRRPEDSALWPQILSQLTDQMSERQELSVAKSRMDKFPPELLSAMVSEGVLTFDGQRYGFGHESLFDYCFARHAAQIATDFIEVLEKDEQELFRRTQLRQVLVYLRDDDFPRYLRSAGRTLSSKKIRPHLKLLVLELLAAFREPRQGELDLLMPLIESELQCRCSGVPTPDKTTTRAWSAFFASDSLFCLADERGHISRWLNSGDETLENNLILYLRFQMSRHPDRVAELLEPFLDKGGKWDDRFRFIMQWADLGASRRFFELFLRLLDDGRLDSARGPIAVNSTFWSIPYELAETCPSWCAEIAAHWLLRKSKIALSSGRSGPDLQDEFGAKSILQSAKGAPKKFLDYVLPAMLTVGEAFAYREQTRLRPDAIWPIRFTGDYLNTNQAFPRGCEMAIESIAGICPEKLRPLITDLRASSLCVANQLLLGAYTSAPAFFADEAVALLSDEPDRLECGVHGSPFWTAKTLIQKCSPHCSGENFRRLEAILLDYRVSFESSKEGFRNKGHSAYMLASSLDLSRCQENTHRRLAEWRRKFGEAADAPDGIRSYEVVSPIPIEAAEHMSDVQWLQAIAKYDKDRSYNWRNPEQGGAYQLAGMFQEFLKKEPERFAQLTLQLPKATNATYFMNALYGLKGMGVSSKLKIDVARRVFELDDNACLMAALDLLASIEDTILPDDALQFIEQMATQHPNPSVDEKAHSDLVQRGINTVRGHGVRAIRNLVLADRANLFKFRNAIGDCINDESLAVRACAASMLSAVAVHDESWAISLFSELVKAPDGVLCSQDVGDFIVRGLHGHVSDLRPTIERMIRSEIGEVQQSGARLACMARLYHPELDDLSEATCSGDRLARLGAAEVASQNLTHAECRAWCEAVLIRFFNDEDDEVRRQAAVSFSRLRQQPDIPFREYDALIRAFIDKKAFVDEPTYLLYAMDETRQPVPETILNVCEVFVTKFADEAKDISTSRAGDETIVGALVFRAYAQLEAQPQRRRALDLIDQMCSEGLQSAGKHLTEFER